LRNNSRFANIKKSQSQENKMSDQVEMEDDEKAMSYSSAGNQGGEKKRFEVKKVIFSSIYFLL
jgi:Fe-S cluster assembly ATPase SufC